MSLSGNMKVKMGGGLSMRTKMFLRLEQGSRMLQIYNNSSSKDPVKTIQLSGVEVVPDKDKEREKFKLNVDGGSIEITAGSVAEAEQWLRLIELEIKGRQVISNYDDNTAIKLANNPAGNPDDSYDLVFGIDSFDDLKRPDVGWKVMLKTEAEKLVTKDGDWLCVSVMGLFNRGKTFILSRLCDEKIQNGDLTHTRGISIKFPKSHKGSNFAIFDTAGKGSPVIAATDERLLDKKTVESFLQETVVELADAIIIVFSRLSFQDQIFLSGLVEHIDNMAGSSSGNNNNNRTSPEADASRRIIVVHNLRDVDSEFAYYNSIQQDIIDCFQASQERFPLQLSSVGSTFAEQANGIYWASTIRRCRIRHVVVIKDGSPFDLKHRINEISFAMIHSWLQADASTVRASYKLMDRFDNFFKKKLRNYVQDYDTIGEDFMRILSTNPDDIQRNYRYGYHLRYRRLLPLVFQDSGLILASKSTEFKFAYDISLDALNCIILRGNVPGISDPADIKVVVGTNYLVVKGTIPLSNHLYSSRVGGYFEESIVLSNWIPYVTDVKGPMEKSVKDGVLYLKIPTKEDNGAVL